MIGVSGISLLNGLVFRCCWTGGHYYDEQNDRFYYPPEFERLFNGFDVPMQKILQYNYWNKLQQFLQGYERSFKLCKSQCGKLSIINRKNEAKFKDRSSKTLMLMLNNGQH